MSTYKSTTEHAAEIRAALKARGWSSRKVSVLAEYYSLGSSITVTIKDITVPLSAVTAIAEAHERIDRCEMTGDILGGGNRYVSVHYDWQVIEAAAKPLVPAVEAAIAQITGSYIIPIEGTNYMVGKRDGWALTLWENGESGRHIRQCTNALDVARGIVGRS